jgi:hypothetical protein
MRIEMKTLEGKDSVKNDLWKDKCKELYDICRELEEENDNLKKRAEDLTQQLQSPAAHMKNNFANVDMHSHTMQNSTSDASNFQPLTREQIILQRKRYGNKPQTANSEHGGRRNLGKSIGIAA